MVHWGYIRVIYVCFSAPGATLVGVQAREVAASSHSVWGFPRIRGTLLGVPIIRTIVFWGLYIGVPLFREITVSFLLLLQQLLPPRGYATTTQRITG